MKAVVSNQPARNLRNRPDARRSPCWSRSDAYMKVADDIAELRHRALIAPKWRGCAAGSRTARRGSRGASAGATPSSHLHVTSPTLTPVMRTGPLKGTPDSSVNGSPETMVATTEQFSPEIRKAPVCRSRSILSTMMPRGRVYRRFRRRWSRRRIRATLRIAAAALPATARAFRSATGIAAAPASAVSIGAP